MTQHIDMAHKDIGNGEPVFLFVHGFCCGSEDWLPQIEKFTKHRRVIAPDLRGHGATQRGSGAISIEQLALDCIDLIRAKGIRQIIVVGHSMGTRVALEVNNIAPALVKGLVLVDGSDSANGDTEGALKEFDKATSDGLYMSWARGLFEGMFFENAHPDLAKFLIDRAMKVPETTAAPLQRDTIAWDGEHVFKSMRVVNVPTLSIQSTTRPPGEARRSLAEGESGHYADLVASLIHGAEIVAIPNFGHFITLEAPEHVNRVIEGWAIRNGFIMPLDEDD